MSNSRPTFQHYIEYAAWRFIALLLKPLPRRAMVVASNAVGWLLYSVFRVRRSVIDGQLTLALGESVGKQRLKQIGLRSWQNAVLTFFEFLQPDPAGDSSWSDFRQREGYTEYVEPLLSEGNGIFLTAHLGNWEALGSLGELGNFKIAAVAKPMHNPLVNDTILQARKESGLEVILTRGSLKQIVNAARSGKWLAMLGDQDARRRGVFVPFFGTPASTAEGPAYFAWRLDLPLVPSFCVRNNDLVRSLKLINLPPIFPNPAAPRDEEIRRLTELHVSALESVVRQYPEDYFWLHRRWKTRPKKKKTGPTRG